MTTPITTPAFGQRSTLIGRQREMAQLQQRFADAVAGRMTVALVSGEPGIGKTRLLDEMATQAHATGARVLHGAATEAEGMPPYLPFLEALGQHIRATPPDDLRAQTGANASILASLLPELHARLGELPKAHALPHEQARLRLYEAIGALLAAIADEQPLLLRLDDLHWADPATLDLLCYIAAHHRDSHMLIVGAYREGEAAHELAFERSLATLHRLRALSLLPLATLPPADVSRLAQGYLGGSLEPSASKLLSRQGEGNPFFVEELLRNWAETGALARTESMEPNQGRWSITPAAAEAEIPSSILTLVRQRLVRLPADTVELLHTAAIIGRIFESALLAEITGSEPESVEERLLVAARAQLIRSMRPGAFAFAHDRVRECLYSDVTAARRTRLHTRLGRLLEARADSPDARRVADLAFHFTRSGDRERGVTYARQAAESAMAAYAFEEAMAHYRNALELLDGSDERRALLLLALGDAAIAAGAEREAVAAYALARTALQASGNSAAAARASHGLGRAAWRLEDLPTTQAAFETTLALLGEDATSERVHALVDLGTLLGVTMHRYAEGLAYGREALALAQQLRDERLIAPATRTVGNMLVRANDLEAGLPLLEDALARSEHTNDPVEATECCACLVMAYLWVGDMEAMQTANEQRAMFAQQCHDPHQMRHAHTMVALVEAYEGRVSHAEDILREAEETVERLSDPEPLAFLQMMQGLVAYHVGDYASAESLFATACRIFRSIGPGALVWYLGWAALAHALQGDVSAARACIAETEALVATIPPASIPVMEALAPVAQAALVLEDCELAGRIYPQLLAFRTRHGDFLPERLLGELATLRRDWPLADAHLAAAEKMTRDGDGSPMCAHTSELARTLAARANLELAWHGRSAQPHARELIQEALTLMERVGMQREAERVREQLGALSKLVATKVSFPDHLTRREVEVLWLIAAGEDNQRIAALLVLSVRTVERHISNIYSKIGAQGPASRAMATAYALRQDLA
ncbi:MAG TPA: AAA family ATPase [Ktedonobacterales bacterium]|nr:AAA family ATPase [Ktedonobacterales bacterium]